MFQVMGRLLLEWRLVKFRHAKSFHEAAKSRLSFSYGQYAEYERGEKLIPAKAIEEIASVLGLDPMPGLLEWFKCHASVAQVARLSYSPAEQPSHAQAASNPSRTLLPVLDSNSIPAAQIDDTWVFDTAELRLIEQQPWLLDFVIQLAMRMPGGMSFQTLGLMTGAAVAAFVRTYISRWIEDERITVDDTSFRLVKRYIHFPKTQKWQATRVLMLEDALRDMVPRLTPEAISGTEVHRTLTSRHLTNEQAQAFIRGPARTLERQFFNLPYLGVSAKEPTQTYTCLVLISPREENLAVRIKQPKPSPARRR